MKQAEFLLHQLDVDQSTARRKATITACTICISLCRVGFFCHLTIKQHLLFIFLPQNKEVEAETGTLVCKQRQDNTIVPHSLLVVDKQEHVWRTLPQTLHQHNLVVLKHKRCYCQISDYSFTAIQQITAS